MSDTPHKPGEPIEHHPHVVPVSVMVAVIVALMILTVVTVLASKVDMGSMNVPVALAIATVKGTLVCAFFMHLRWDKPFNSIILVTSIGMLVLFLVMTGLDTMEYQSSIDPGYSERAMQAEREVLASKIAGKPVKGDDVLDVLYKHDDPSHASSGHVDERAVGLQAKAKAFFGQLPKVAAAPANNLSSPEKEALGKALFFDGRLSKSGQISCNSCHLLDKWGADGEATSPGHEGKRGNRNSPTVYYAALHESQFWDGRAPSLEAQAKGPILNPVEMAMPSEQAVVDRLKGIAGYGDLFKKAFPAAGDDPITYDNLAKAIASFERTLLPTSPLPAMNSSKGEALSAAQLDGMELFFSTGCTQCHLGAALGGTTFKKLGDRVAYPTQDKGRFEVTKKESDTFFFKVSSLRNVAKTGPYFHDGSVKTLDEAVKLMAKHQLDKDLSAEQVKKISAFLESLTATIDPAVAKAPTLPQ
jgi:cytochrome c peroxidase